MRSIKIMMFASMLFFTIGHAIAETGAEIAVCPGTTQKPEEMEAWKIQEGGHVPDTIWKWDGKVSSVPDGWKVNAGSNPREGSYTFFFAIRSGNPPQVGKPETITCIYSDYKAGVGVSLERAGVIGTEVVESTGLTQSQWAGKWGKTSSAAEMCGCSSGVCITPADCPFTPVDANNNPNSQ